MIMNESGIHTFCLKRKYSYSEIQNIIEQNKCFCCGKDRYELSSYYQITQYKSRGVEIQMSQTLSANRSFQAEYGFCRNEALSSLHSQRYRSIRTAQDFQAVSMRSDLQSVLRKQGRRTQTT